MLKLYMFQNQSTRSIWRGIVAFIAFALPLAIGAFPEYANLTLGAVLFTILHFIEKTVTQPPVSSNPALV